MRFLPSNPGRVAAEVLLTVAVAAFVVYDLTEDSSATSVTKPEASSNVVLTFEAKKLSALPAAEDDSARFDASVTDITANNILQVCGDVTVKSNPWIIGSNGTNQALIVLLGGGCSFNPALQTSNTTNNVTSLVPITVRGGSWLSFQNIYSQNAAFAQGGGAGATSGLLTMDPTSILEAVFSVTQLDPNPFVNLGYPILFALGDCPDFTQVSIRPVVNCPIADPVQITTGVYTCGISFSTVTSNSVTRCTLLATVFGPLTTASAPITMTIGKDCATFTIANFKTVITGVTGIGPLGINVLAWICGSITVTFTVLGGNVALINAAVASILAASAPGGALYTSLGGITLGGSNGAVSGTTTTNGDFKGYYPVAYCRYYPCPTTLPFDPSSSNPGLLALLTLLVIPVAIFVALLIYACLPRLPVCEPVPVCPPAPVCPAPMYCAEPCIQPCITPLSDPCAATPISTPPCF